MRIQIRNFPRPVIALALSGICSFSALAYIRTATNLLVDPSPAPLFRIDNTGIQFLLNSGVVAGASASGRTVITAGSDPAGAIRSALGSWNAVGTANVKFLPLKSTTLGIDSNDGNMVIAIAGPADQSVLNGALAFTANLHANSDGLLLGQNVVKGTIVDSDVILNPAYTFSTDGSSGTYDFQSVMVHELGHALGANHTGMLAGVMFQFPTGHYLSTDDVAFVNAAYPLSNGATPLGTISGKVSTQSGSAVPYALLTAFDTSTGVTTGGITNADGTYSFSVPPGSYQIYAEPLNGAVAINIYLTLDQLNLAAGTQFQTTFFSGAVPIAAGGAGSADITVTAGATTLSTPFFSSSAVNGTPGLFFSDAAGNPLPLFVTAPSGGSIDLVFAGAGFDSSLSDSNFSMYGKGLTVRSGSVRVDTSSYKGFKLLRVTVDVAANTPPGLASFVVTRGTSKLSFSGAIAVVPPTPTFTAAGVISAAAYSGIQGGVTPGGIYTIYSQQGAPNLGPGGVDATKYVGNGPYDPSCQCLATTLAGVTVTFDGVPAPLFLSWGYQLNLQVPFEVAGKSSTKVVVTYNGSASAAVTVPVLKAQPSFFTINADGKTAIAVNQDGSLNTAQTPATKGSFITVYGTGVGQVSYAIRTAQAAPAFPQGYSGNYTYTIGGSAAAPALFGGYTPTAVGLTQWNLQIPANSATGQVPITVTDSSGVSSPAGMTIFVK